MKALVISYYFPPFGGGPTIRVHNFVKHLPRNHVPVAVVTADSSLYEKTYADPELLNEYDPPPHIYRTTALFGSFLRKQREIGVSIGGQSLPFWSLNRWKKVAKRLLVPDEYIFWVAKSISVATRAAREEKIDVILATAPPFSAFWLASLVSQRINKPLVLDYRDLWTPNVFYRSNWATRQLERKILNRASHVIVTNEAARSSMIEHFGLASGKISVLANGFEGDLLEEIERGPRKPSESFRMNYIGSLTARRTPEFFFAAVRRLLTQRPQLKLSIGILGFVPPTHKQLAQQMGLSQIVHFLPPVSRRRALEIMRNETDLLILLQRNSEGGDSAIPGKLYEYLGTGIPFIAMDEDGGATAKLLKQLDAPRAVDYEDVDAITHRLSVIVEDYPSLRQQFDAIRPRTFMYDRRRQVTQLAQVLTEIVSGAHDTGSPLG